MKASPSPFFSMVNPTVREESFLRLKAVSNTATMGTPGITAWQALMPVMLAGLWRGARGLHSSMVAMTSSVMRTDLANFSPPCTTRWPTASISFMEPMTPLSASTRAFSTAWMASEWVGMATSTASSTFLPSIWGL